MVDHPQWPTLDEEGRARLREELLQLEKIVGYRRPLCSPEEEARYHELNKLYPEIRDKLLALYEKGEISIDIFCDRFRKEASPLREEARSILEMTRAFHDFLSYGT